MNPSIQAICFDIGGTLRVAEEIDAGDLGYVRKLQAFIADRSQPDEFRAALRAREKQYRRWCKRSLIELSEAELWARFMLPDLPGEFVRANGVKLNQMWRESRDKSLLPDAVATLRELARRGYALAIISNTTSSVEVPALLEANGIQDLFTTVTNSSSGVCLR
jgi:FMN phosphatase YigB (HAD superfamily)